MSTSVFISLNKQNIYTKGVLPLQFTNKCKKFYMPKYKKITYQNLYRQVANFFIGA